MQKVLNVTGCGGFSSGGPSADPIVNVSPGTSTMPSGQAPAGTVAGGALVTGGAGTTLAVVVVPTSDVPAPCAPPPPRAPFTTIPSPPRIAARRMDTVAILFHPAGGSGARTRWFTLGGAVT